MIGIRSLTRTPRDGSETPGLGSHPSRYRRRFCDRRLSYDVKKERASIRKCIAQRALDLVRIGDALCAEAKPARNRRVIHCTEIDAEIPVIVIEVLQLFDPAKRAV